VAINISKFRTRRTIGVTEEVLMELRRRGFLKGMGALGGVAVGGIGFDPVAQAILAAPWAWTFQR
jgi:hypothetical protein